MSRHPNAPKTAMVLAAGLGTRMRPLTDDRPKALVEVGGRALIDHVLDRLVEAGVEKAVVNVHWFADRLEEHLSRRKDVEIVISDERAELLETGGGLKKARALLGEDPVWVANIDSVWINDPGRNGVLELAEYWEPAQMDAFLLLAPLDRSLGYDGEGDFMRGFDFHLTFRSPGYPASPYMGVHITKPQIVDDQPEGPFSLSRIWRRLADESRLFGHIMSGDWMHVGDPVSRDEAEAKLRGVG